MQFIKEIALNDAKASAQNVETERMNTLKVSLPHKLLANKPEDEDLEGPADICSELHLKKHLRCAICKGIPVAPILQCKKTEKLYCGVQCLERAKKAEE